MSETEILKLFVFGWPVILLTLWALAEIVAVIFRAITPQNPREIDQVGGK
jgi:hypothetical protein